MTMIDTATWDRMLGYCWPERVRMLYLKDHNPALFPGFLDESIDFHLADPAVAIPLAGPLVIVTWHGAPDRPVDVG